MSMIVRSMNLTYSRQYSTRVSIGKEYLPTVATVYFYSRERERQRERERER
jgi:hypothetical protein